MTTNRDEGRPDGLVKIMFRLDAGAWHGSATETVWAEPLGPQRYRLRNVPFYAFGVSVEDEVITDDGALPVVLRAANRGGHSTYRVVKNMSRADDFEAFWEPLHAL